MSDDSLVSSIVYFYDFNFVGKPTLRKLKHVKIVKDGHDVVMTCEAESGWPLPRVSWWKKGLLVRDGDFYESFTLDRLANNILIMRILGTEGYHHGTYTCRAENMFGTSVEEVNIMVKRKQTVVLDLNFSL